MNVVIVTSLNRHHRFIISEIYRNFKNISIIKDIKTYFPTFNTNHKLKNLQKKYERRIWLNKNLILPKIQEIKNINIPKNIKKIKKLRPDIIVALGSNRLTKKFIQSFKKTSIVNLHGGNPNYYRGLDSHYWSIYHNDYENLQVCIHQINEGLDTGKIIEIQKIKLFKNMKLYQLRSKNAVVACKILSNYLKKVSEKKKIKLKANKHGRYYSSMPSSLIKIIEKKFFKFTKKIK